LRVSRMTDTSKQSAPQRMKKKWYSSKYHGPMKVYQGKSEGRQGLRVTTLVGL